MKYPTRIYYTEADKGLITNVSCASSSGAVEYRSQEPAKATARTMNGIIIFLKVFWFIQIRRQHTCVSVRSGSKAGLLIDSLRYFSSVEKLGAGEHKKTPRSAIAAFNTHDTSRDKLHQLPIGRAC